MSIGDGTNLDRNYDPYGNPQGVLKQAMRAVEAQERKDMGKITQELANREQAHNIEAPTRTPHYETPLTATEAQRRQDEAEAQMEAAFREEQQKFSNRFVAKVADALLGDRSMTHGDWHRTADLSKRIKEVLNFEHRLDNLSAPQSESLALIAVKISRILCGNPNHADHWNDIAGYARLVAKELEEKANG